MTPATNPKASPPAAAGSSSCSVCGEQLQEVWRMYSARRLVALCEWCARERADRDYWSPPLRCEGCERRVFLPVRHAGRGHTYCSTACSTTVRTARDLAQRRSRRARARGEQECEGCGEVFTPARADTKTCRRACRDVARKRRRDRDGSDGHRLVFQRALRAARAQQGNPEWVVYCPSPECRVTTMPVNGKCMFCGGDLGQPGALAVAA